MLRHFLYLSAAISLPLFAAVPDHHRNTYSDSDTEALYAAAKATLEDPSQIHVERVPDMLKICAQNGHARGARLLLDVCEGRFKGLDAAPEDAFQLATSIAGGEMPFPDDVNGENMQADAIFHLARYYEQGYGCERDLNAAFVWMERAARKLPQGKVELARMLMRRDHVTSHDKKRAWQLLHGVAQTAPETPHVFLYMGTLCFQEHNRRSLRKAARLYYYGSLYCDADCMNNLGAMYERGIAVEEDSAKALSLYRKSASLGNKQASANMQRLAFKEGAAAGRRLATPPQTRIQNALLCIIDNLPIRERSQKRLLQWLHGERIAPRS